MGLIYDELQEVKKLCENVVAGSEIISCVESLVRVEIRKTRIRAVVICIQFPPEYPTEIILFEIKSKTLPDVLLKKITSSCEEELKKLLGKPQILPCLKFVNNFIEENPLICCYEEISEIKKLLSERDELKVKQKSSVIILKISKKNYYVKAKFSIPEEYPDKRVSFDLESNLPSLLQCYLYGQGKELSRQCVEPPLNSKKKSEFKVKPSVLPVAKHLITSLHDFVVEPCQVCRQPSLPDDPEKVITDETAADYVERVYCGHLYHVKCLLQFLKTPPFKGGKNCPSCKQRIYHDKWKVSDKLAEDRWAHKQARDRELQEVVDFLS